MGAKMQAKVQPVRTDGGSPREERSLVMIVTKTVAKGVPAFSAFADAMSGRVTAMAASGMR